jgi:hypothetical protein
MFVRSAVLGSFPFATQMVLAVFGKPATKGRRNHPFAIAIASGLAREMET